MRARGPAERRKVKAAGKLLAMGLKGVIKKQKRKAAVKKHNEANGIKDFDEATIKAAEEELVKSSPDAREQYNKLPGHCRLAKDTSVALRRRGNA